MTIDIHKAIGKLPIIPKKGFTLPNMNYCGPYNPLDKQVIYDENGNIIKYIQNPTGKTDAICAQHDIDYALSRNINDKHNADKRMINSIKSLPYKDKQLGTFLVKNIINTKQKLGMGNNFTMEDLSEELNKPVTHKFKRKKTIVNYIDHIHSADLVDMKMYSKINKGYNYIFTNIDIFSKYAWAFPIKTKKIQDVKLCFQKIFKERKPDDLWTDKISKNMLNAIKFNKDIHKLSKNEKNYYYEILKYLNKGQDISILIGNYLAGNNSKDLFNIINKILYDKYKNNLITQKEYTNLLSKINNV